MSNQKNNNELLDEISIYEGTIEISSATHDEYIAYHEKTNSNKYDYQKTIAESKSLFDKKSSLEIKKKILFLLGGFATPESFKLLKLYIDDQKTTHKDWAMLALQELRFHVENELYDEGKDMIITPLGGKGNKTRCYVVVSKKSNKALTEKEKLALSKAMHTVAKNKKSEVEDIEFGTSYMLIKILVSIHIALQDVIDTFLDVGSTDMKILRYHFFSINTRKPTKKDISEYLDSNEVKIL